MTTIDNNAKARIKELEEQIEDLTTVSLIQADRITELEAECKVKAAQIRALSNGQQVDYGVAG